ncbi:amino acid--tRNA ligase-related protein [Guyparkeria sp.]|uniref:amino acid--tRNA ligase-related protein n=1 Tax=Guyparkeria sp. TaxID=2035736 RepID=UPI0039705B1E
MLEARARLKRVLRDELERRDSLEVDTPALIRSGDFEPNIALFRVSSPNGSPAGSLHSSPELMMKRLLCAHPTLPGIHYLGPVFRAGEAGARHNPEFTMLEWYETGSDLDAAISTTLELIQAARQALDLAPAPVAHRDYGLLFRERLGLDPYQADTAMLQRTAHLSGIAVHEPGRLDRDEWLDLLMSSVIEPSFPDDRLTVVKGFPASQAAMARLETIDFEEHRVRVAARFEVFGGKLELANGYHELADPAEQAERLPDPAKSGTDGRSRRLFLEALEHGLPDCSGVAMGFDRLLMWLTEQPTLDTVLPFSERRV